MSVMCERTDSDQLDHQLLYTLASLESIIITSQNVVTTIPYQNSERKKAESMGWYTVIVSFR